LADIPAIVFHESTAYELRGVLNYHKGKTQLRNSIGHYTAYCKRQAGNWELYDDLKKNPKAVSIKTVVACELLLYTI